LDKNMSAKSKVANLDSAISAVPEGRRLSA